MVRLEDARNLAGNGAQDNDNGNTMVGWHVQGRGIVPLLIITPNYRLEPYRVVGFLEPPLNHDMNTAQHAHWVMESCQMQSSPLTDRMEEW